MKKLSLIILTFNFAVLTALFSFSPKDTVAVPEKRWDANWIDCEGIEPPHVLNHCKDGSIWVTCVNSNCAIMLPGITVGY